ANGVQYVQAALDAGMVVDQFAPRLSFFFVSRTTLLEEVAKFRAARRIWARLMRERFHAQHPRSLTLRFHAQTAGVQLTAQQPEVNMVRVTTQAIAAIFGGAKSLHTNAYDEAIALPTEKAARLALRTQQVLAYETDLTSTVDPFAGSYAIETMTDEVEAAAMALIEKVDELGGAVRAIEAGFQKSEIEWTAYQTAMEIDSGDRVVVGLNRYRLDAEDPYQPLRVDPAIEDSACERLAALRSSRSFTEVDCALDELRHAAKDTTRNVLYPMKRALAARATVGEVCHALREVWGTYMPAEKF
ncbi:MAG: methylmalonyl-CoA mutase family protein, partial [Pseudonocardiaceae bacterium]